MKKTLAVILTAVLLFCLCACSGAKIDNSKIVGTWVSEDRSSYDEKTYTNQQGISVPLEENTYNGYTIVFYEDGSYESSYSYEKITYDYNSNPARRITKSGQEFDRGSWTSQGDTVILTAKTGATTRLTYTSDGVLKGPQSEGYTYQRQG